MRRDTSSTDPQAAAQLAALIKRQATAVVKEINRNTKKRQRVAAESDQESDNEESNNSDSDDRDSDTHNHESRRDDSNEDSDKDCGPYTWIGKWVKKPAGERCRNPKEGREGFTTSILLKKAGITKEQYSMYKVYF